MQLKDIVIAGCTVFVFLPGLVSCSADSPGSSGAPFRLQEPTLMIGDGQPVSWKKAESQPHLPLSDSSYIEIPKNDKAFHLHVKAVCKTTDSSYAGDSVFYNPRKIQFGAIVPIEAQLKPGEQFKCRFEMMAQSAEGARHLFSLGESIYQTGFGGLRLVFKKDSAPVNVPDAPLPLPMPEWRRYSVAPDRDLKRLSLECEHHWLPVAIKGRELIELSHVDIAAARGRHESSGPLGRYPNQSCRIIGVNNDGSRVMSPLLHVQFPEIRLEKRFAPVPPARGTLSLGVWEVTNPTDQALDLMLPKPGQQKITATIIDGTGIYSQIKLRVKFDSPARNGDSLRIEPGAGVLIHVSSIDRLQCRPPEKNRGFLHANPERTIVFFDQDGVGPWLAETSQAKPGPTFVTPWPRDWQQSISLTTGKPAAVTVEDLEKMRAAPGPCSVRR